MPEAEERRMGSRVLPRGVRDSTVPRLFCFPYAGGTASVFRGWREALAHRADVVAVELPGHGSRIREILHTHIETLVDDLAERIQPLLDRPYVFFGHSLGGLLSFELTHHLARRQLPLPSRLIISASRAPSRWGRDPARHTLSDREMIDELRQMNGTPSEILQNTELMELLLPSLRADFAVCDTYQPAHSSPLDIPFTIIGGSEDRHVTNDDLVAWNECTSAGADLVVIPGDHFFIHAERSQLITIIISALALSSARATGR